MEIRRSVASCAVGDVHGQRLFEIGMMYATGLRPFDLVSAHMFFNLAAARGNDRAMGLRQEIAAEMSREQIAAAQRAARDCLTTPRVGDAVGTFSEVSKGAGSGFRTTAGPRFTPSEPLFVVPRSITNDFERLAVGY
jgi:hypothetical protein